MLKCPANNKSKLLLLLLLFLLHAFSFNLNTIGGGGLFFLIAAAAAAAVCVVFLFLVALSSEILTTTPLGSIEKEEAISRLSLSLFHSVLLRPELIPTALDLEFRVEFRLMD